MTEIQLTFVGELDTQKELEYLYGFLNSQDSLQIADKIGLVLYGFQIIHKNGQWTVYKTHNEIITFLKKYSKKYKKSFTFQTIRNNQNLRNLAQQPDIVHESWFQEFFQLDAGSQGSVLEGKKKIVTLKKKAGGRYYKFQCSTCIGWKSCDAIITKDGIIMCKHSSKVVQEFMHFGKDFKWETVEPFDRFTMTITSYHRKMTLKAHNQKQFFLFCYFLEHTLGEYKREQEGYRFMSFAPWRTYNEVDFFVDGADYYQSLAHNIESARQQIFICGWWVCPQFHLIRPCEGKNLDYRLDNLLARMAKKGVKIYIIVYFESSFLTNDSAYTVEALQAMHQKNIKVLRHPQIILPTFWSHHQKLVVIDQEVAYMGGLDICYGRYDTCDHLIDDNDPSFHPGIEYNNCRINDFVNVRNYRKQNVERSSPRLPWHDVALRVLGKSVKDLSRHFIEYWNYASYQTHYADRFVLVTRNPEKTKTIVQKKQTKLSGLFDTIKGFAVEMKEKIRRDSKDLIGTQSDQVERSQKYSIPEIKEANEMQFHQVKSKMVLQKKEDDQNKTERFQKNQSDQQIKMKTPEKRQGEYYLSYVKRQSFQDRIIQKISPATSISKRKKSRFQPASGTKSQQFNGHNMRTGDRLYEGEEDFDSNHRVKLQNDEIRFSPIEGALEGVVINTLGSQEIAQEDIKIRTIPLIKYSEKKQYKLSRFNPDSDEKKKEEQDSDKFKLSSRVMTEQQQIKQQENIEMGQQLIKQNLQKMHSLEKKIDEEDQYIQSEHISDFINQKSKERYFVHSNPSPFFKNFGKGHSSVQSSPPYHQKGDENQSENNITAWMKKLIKKTKQTFGKQAQNDHPQQKKSLQPELEFAETCQVLRSVSQWSIGCEENNFQKSISNAYEDVISQAKKFIYIQNQFFISATKSNGVVKNRVMQKICERIIKAIQNQQQFKVIVFMPLIPGFAGELDDPNATLPRVIMNWQYKSICRGSGSLFERIKKYTKHPERYVSFYGLRNHGVINSIPKTQIIYLHSKLIIVDDRKLICGSANINDRSMEGNRDSQLCLLVQASPNKKIKINDETEEFQVVEKIHNLRRSLISEHFGLSDKDSIDIMGKKSQNLMSKIAQKNTQTYRNLFGCYPDDNISNLSQIKDFRKPVPELEVYQKQIENIHGHVVEFPLQFLKDQKLTSYHPNALST